MAFINPQGLGQCVCRRGLGGGEVVHSAAFRIWAERLPETWLSLGTISSTHLYFKSSEREPGEEDSSLSQPLSNTKA